MFLLALGARNLSRNVTRTVVTSVAVVAGVALMILGWGLVDGLDDNMLRAARLTYAGEVILRPDGYPDDGMRFPLDEARPISEELRAKLDAAGTWTARTAFPARLIHQSEAQRITVWSYDGATETGVFSRKGWVTEGSWPDGSAAQVVVGRSLARLLELKVGDDIVLEARTRDGAINALSYAVVGVVSTDNTSLDNLGVWMLASSANDLALLGEARTHIALLPKGDATAAKTSLSSLGWSPLTLAEECEDLIALNRVRRKSLSVIVGMIMLIAATGIANTVIMAAFERIREIGTLLALGMRRREVAALFLIEGGVMGLVAGTLGAVLGASAVLHWQRVGIDLSASLEQVGGNIAMSTMVYTRFGWPPTLVSLCFGVGVAVLASVWPAWHASHIVPADAVRAD